MGRPERRPAVFFDRDGVLNEDRGFVSGPERFAWIQGAPEAVRWLNDRGYLVMVVTNQSGIGRGFYTESDFNRFTGWIDEQLRPYGARIDATYFCPHHPRAEVERYRKECDCRKPRPGMLTRAVNEWNVDAARSILIGDEQRDIDAATAAGIRGVLFPGGDLLDFVRELLEPGSRPAPDRSGGIREKG